MYEHEWTCRWEHLDPAEFAFYPRLIMACHEAGDAFLDELGYSYWDIPHDHGIHFPLVEVGFDFERPVQGGDRLRIAVDPDLGNSSLRLEYTAIFDESDAVAFTGYEQRVCMAAETGQSTPLPDEFRDDVETYSE